MPVIFQEAQPVVWAFADGATSSKFSRSPVTYDWEWITKGKKDYRPGDPAAKLGDTP